jgi:glutamine synthetase
MLGSSNSISDANTVLNTIVAESLRQFADILEGAEDFTSTLNKLVADTMKKHRRILFNGNNYSEEWKVEAEKRGLLNLVSSDVAIPNLKAEKNVKLFETHGVFTRAELESRSEIMLENYSKTINIEALTMIDIAKKEIYPAVNDYLITLGKAIKTKKELAPDYDHGEELKLFKTVAQLNASLAETSSIIDELLHLAKGITGTEELAHFYRNKIFASMQELRTTADRLERMVGKTYWPMPSYDDLLFSV